MSDVLDSFVLDTVKKLPGVTIKRMQSLVAISMAIEDETFTASYIQSLIEQGKIFAVDFMLNGEDTVTNTILFPVNTGFMVHTKVTGSNNEYVLSPTDKQIVTVKLRSGTPEEKFQLLTELGVIKDLPATEENIKKVDEMVMNLLSILC